MIGWYYLHENGSLIYRQGEDAVVDIRDSDFSRAMWRLDPTNRADAWRIIVEAGAAGADPARIAEFAALWKCTDEDAGHYAKYEGARLYMDGNAWCATKNDFEDLQASPAGFGETAREALTELAKALGCRVQKMWGASFRELLTVEAI